jgi:glycosyltransferase involved in cell wall biosynthesis
MAVPAPHILHCITDAEAPAGFPRFSGQPGPAKLISIAQAMKGYDLVVSHGWEAINVALAHKVFGQHLGLPPLIHQEHGSADFEAQEARLKRKIIRRIGLGSVHTFVTPVQSIGDFAVSHWGVPPARVATIQPGIDLKRFRPNAKPDALPGLIKRPTEKWIGAFLKPGDDEAAAEVLNLGPDLPRDWHLVLIAGDTPTDVIRARADELGLSHRVHMLGRGVDEAKALALCDLYVELAGRYEFASGTAKAMATATPVIKASDGGLLSGLEDLILDEKKRERVAKENRETALKNFNQTEAAEGLSELYKSAMTR